jgi:hypothetical protein
LGVQRFVGVLGWCWFGALWIALAAIVVNEVHPTGVEPWTWWAIWGGGAAGLGILTAAAWSVIRGRGPIEAAIEIDRRYRLKERVSSALALSDAERDTDAGRALVDDAVSRVRQVDLREHFTISPGRQILLPLLPVVAAVLVVLLVDAVADDSQAQADTNSNVKQQVQALSQTLRRKLREQSQRAEKQGLKDARDLFKHLEEGIDDLAKQAKGDRKQALVKLNDVARQINRRRQELGGADKIRQQLDQLKNVKRGPADKFLDAVKRGDFQQAVEELDRLKEKLADGDMSKDEQQQLAHQLNQVQEKLERLADAHQQAMNDLRQRIDQARQSGQNDEADKLEEQLNALRQQMPQMGQLRDLADQLGQCSECLQNDQLQDAGEMLDQLSSQLSGLQEQLQEMDMLNQALDQLSQCRNQMNCPKCGGAGCGNCQGQQPGQGLGRGQGAGDRPDQEDEVDFTDVRPPMKVGPGGATIVGQTEGPNFKGDFQQQMKDEFQATRQQSADPLVGQQMSRQQQDHAREYFDRFREHESE